MVALQSLFARPVRGRRLSLPPMPQQDRGPRDPWSAVLIAVATQGDRRAFEALYRHFVPRLKAYCLRQGADSATAEELAQETLLLAWRKAARFDPARGSVASWLFTIIRNKRIDRLRREPRPGASPEGLDDLATLAACDQADSRALAASEAAHWQLQRAALSPAQQQVLEKAFFEDKSHSMIAAELGMPLGTVKSRLRQALLALKLFGSAHP